MKTYRYINLVAFLSLIILLNAGCGKKNNLSLPEADKPASEHQDIKKPNRDKDPI